MFHSHFATSFIVLLWQGCVIIFPVAATFRLRITQAKACDYQPLVILKEKVDTRIKYSLDVDVLVIQLRRGKPVDSRDIVEGVIVHLSKKGIPLELEILDASRMVERKDVEVAMEKLTPKNS